MKWMNIAYFLIRVRSCKINTHLYMLFILFQRKLKQSTVKNKIQPEFFFCINGGDQNLFTEQTKQFCH